MLIVARRLPNPIRRLGGLLRRIDKRLFDLAVRWPTLTDEQISRALGALDQEPVALPGEREARRPIGPTSTAIAEAEARLRRIKQARQQREANRWWRRRLQAEGLSLPFAAWTVFTRGPDGAWMPAGASSDRAGAERIATSLAAHGVEAALVAWDPQGGGRLVPPG